jgi:ribonuclease D
VFDALPDVTFLEKPFDPEGFWRNKAARDLRPAELAVLRELYLWRDQEARRLDRPPFKVLGDDALVRLSQRQPRRLADLELSPRQVRTFGQALLEAIVRGRASSPPRPPARQINSNGRPDPATTARFDRLRVWRGQRAAERGVDPDVVLNNEALMVIARACPATSEELAALGVMRSWKLEEYGADVLRVVAEG